jgi:hypothetical protein
MGVRMVAKMGMAPERFKFQKISLKLIKLQKSEFAISTPAHPIRHVYLSLQLYFTYL